MTVRIATPADAALLNTIQTYFAAEANVWFPGGVVGGSGTWGADLIGNSRVWLSTDATGPLGALIVHPDLIPLADKDVWAEDVYELAPIPPATLRTLRGGTLVHATVLWVATVKELLLAWFADAEARAVPFCTGRMPVVAKSQALITYLGTKAAFPQDAPKAGWARWVVTPTSARATLAVA